MNKIICIAGPTASGKTALSIALAKELGGEVVSCDSMQVYKRMDIGTAKPTLEEMDGVPHHMLSVTTPDQTVSTSTKKERTTLSAHIKARSRLITTGITLINFQTSMVAGGAQRLCPQSINPQRAIATSS